MVFDVPGTTRGWTAAHVGGILNGVMIAAMSIDKSSEDEKICLVGWLRIDHYGLG